MPIDKAEKLPNVKRFFGEKYGDEVRVVFIDPKFSIEFCGGTHVNDTSDIGLFKIIKEESVSSGTRRIVAVSGEGILNYLNDRISDTEKIISGLPDKYGGSLKPAVENLKKSLAGLDFRDAGTLKKLIEYQDATVSSLEELREKFLEEKKLAEKTLSKQKVNEASALLDKYISKGTRLDGLNIVTAEFDLESMDELKEIGDSLRQKIGSGVGVLYSIIGSSSPSDSAHGSLSGGKINIVAVVTDNLIKEKGMNAGKIANDIAKILGGGGGGRPHLATAGGKDISKLDTAISEIKNIVQNYLSKNK
jgi:alanyl-tRNA synthetase